MKFTTNFHKEVVMNKYLVILIIAGLFLVSCEDNDYPDSVYDKNAVYGDSPEISDVQPIERVYAGISDITITGQYFSDEVSANAVFFSGSQATVLSASATELVVRAPIIEGDSLKVQVTTTGTAALEIGEYSPYKIEFAAIEYGGVNDQTGATAVACDDSEYVYVQNSTLMKIIKIPADGSDPVDFAQTPEGALITLKMGPGGYLYGGRTKFLYKISPDGATVERFGGRLGQSLSDLDFDENGNMFVAAKKYVYCVKSDGSNFEAADNNIGLGIYYYMRTIRVYDGYVYTAGDLIGYDTTVVQEGIWRYEILNANGDLGPSELMFDWTSYAGLGGQSITAITFADDGTMYVGLDDDTNTDEDYAIVLLAPDGSGSYINSVPEPLYDAVLIPPASHMVWGNDQYLYVNRPHENTELMTLIRITTGKMSAPYYGR